MAQRKTLTERQIGLLRWIADGCPTGVMSDEYYRISAAALRSRGLVTTSGRGQTWEARITDTGREYLRNVDGPNPPIPRQGNISVAQQLVDDVLAAGGVLRVPRANWYEPGGINYEKRAQAARQFGKVPSGKRLTTSYVDGELEIRLEDAIYGTEISVQPVDVPRRVTRLHPVAQRFRDDVERHEVSRRELRRCVRIVHALANALEQRGHQLANVTKTTGGYRGDRWAPARDGHLLVTVREHQYRLRVSEEKVSVRGYFERSSVYLRPHDRDRYDAGATGRLQISIDGYSREGRPASWADRRSWTLEEKLGELLRELEVRAAEDDHRALERKRLADERRARWELAVASAKDQLREHRRAQVLRDQVAAWQQAEAMRGYLDVLQERWGENEWLAWARQHVDAHLDPLGVQPTMPEDPATINPEDLRPFLNGLSPYGPD
jgi:hypothetical protein